jgi:hypothetical protein
VDIGGGEYEVDDWDVEYEAEVWDIEDGEVLR